MTLISLSRAAKAKHFLVKILSSILQCVKISWPRKQLDHIDVNERPRTDMTLRSLSEAAKTKHFCTRVPCSILQRVKINRKISLASAVQI